MNDKKFELWCKNATALIRYGPDRKAVEAELMAHLEDHRDALRAGGMEYKEAEAEAIRAMGDSKEVAQELARVHRPFWGYAYRITKVVAVLLCSLALIFLIYDIGNTARCLLISSGNPSTMQPGDGRQWELVAQAEPRASVWADGHWIKIPDACFWKWENEYRLCLHLQVVTPFRQANFEAYSYFWAVDSQGNYYCSWDEGRFKDVPRIAIGGGHFSSQYQCFDMDVWGIPSADIEWVELHYDRDGRDIVLRIDLAGGDGT